MHNEYFFPWRSLRLGERYLFFKFHFTVSEKGGKDNSGDYIYVKNGNGQYTLDKNGHLIVDHDLRSHDGELQDGIVEAFIDWAKYEKLSFCVED